MRIDGGKIGYACVTLGVPGTAQRSCTAKNASPALLEELISYNLDALLCALHYNADNGILLFRISSGLIPFGSSPVNTLDWRTLFAARFEELGVYVRQKGMRLSMHPGQYTVLNSPNGDTAQRAADDLLYHCNVLDAMGLPPSCKIVLHAGGVYGDPSAAMDRFCARFARLPERVRARLVLENDEHNYTAEDVLTLSKRIGAPMVFDVFHHELNPSAKKATLTEWLSRAAQTWAEEDGPPKLHYSQQAEGKRRGSHSDTIRIDPFLALYNTLPKDAFDVMLEVKDKNLSALKCLNCTKSIPYKRVEEEWARYKYAVLDRSQKIYLEIRALLRNGGNVAEFYRLTQKALALPTNPGELLNAAQHVWGYFKKDATPTEHRAFLRAAQQIPTRGAGAAKRLLFRLAKKYSKEYLLFSYYFVYGM